MASKRLAAALVLAAVTGGCAQNVIRLEKAQAVSERSTATARSVSAYFAELERRRRAAAATLIASDPSCGAYLRFDIQVPDTIRRSRDAALCPPLDGPPAKGFLVTEVDFTETPARVLKPRLMLIAAIADYGAALAKIVADPQADLSAEFGAFAEKVDRFGKLLDVVIKDDVPTLSGVAQSDEGKSILALAQFAADLAKEDRQVGDVRALVRDHGKAVDDALARLDAAIAGRVADQLQRTQRTRIDALSNAYDRDAPRLTFEQRRERAVEVLDARAEQATVAESTATVQDAIAETQAAQKALRRVLLGDFTRAEKRRILSANLDRLTHAFELIADVGAAFA